jgi:transcriptional regulator with XRE-family HTH domain
LQQGSVDGNGRCWETSAVSKKAKSTTKNETAFVSRLQELLRSTGKSRSDMGSSAGLSHDTVGKWIRENVAQPGKTEDAIKLATKYGVSLEWLLGTSSDGGPTAPRRQLPIDAPKPAPPDESGERWKALLELVDHDGYAPGDAFHAVRDVQFHHTSDAPVTWGDFYSQAKRTLRSAAAGGALGRDEIQLAAPKRR